MIQTKIMLSNITSGLNANSSAISKIMAMADKKNIINMGLDPAKIISFGGGWVNHKTPKALQNEYKKISNNSNLFHTTSAYSSPEGTLELRTSLAQVETKLFGTKGITAENIIIGQSSTQLTLSLFLATLNPTDKVILFNPTYANYPEQLRLLQRQIIYLNVFNAKSWTFMQNENEILTKLKELLEKEKPKLILFCSPCNPTGQIIPDNFIKKVLCETQKHNCFVAIDFAYAPIHYSKETPQQYGFSPKKYPNLIKIFSNSKWTRSLGRRLGWVQADKEVINAIKIIQQGMILSPDLMHQTALTNYLNQGLENGSIKKYNKELVKKYKKAADFTMDCIDKYLGMQYLKPNGGIYAVVNVNTNGEKFATEILQNTGVMFIPGNGFGTSLEKGIRISFGPLVNDLDKIEEGFSRVKTYIDKQPPQLN